MNIDKYFIHSIVLLSLSALFFPFWITLILAIFFVFVFENFYPAPLVFFVMDCVYSFENVKSGMFFGSLTIFSLLGFLLINFLKKKIFILK